MISEETYLEILGRVMRTVRLAGIKAFEEDLALLMIELKRGRAVETLLGEILPVLKKAHEIVDDDLEERAARHSLGKLHVELERLIEKIHERIGTRPAVQG